MRLRSLACPLVCLIVGALRFLAADTTSAHLLAADPPKFASVQEAMAVYDATANAKDPEAGKLRVQAEAWLTKQGAAITPQLAKILRDSKASQNVRMTACRQLAKRGAAARPPLLETIEKDTGLIRLRAIETLGKLEPADEASVKLLQKLMDDADVETRRAALTGISFQGKAAASAVPRLQQILNDTKEEEGLRELAKRALKSVDPRKGLIDVK